MLYNVKFSYQNDPQKPAAKRNNVVTLWSIRSCLCTQHHVCISPTSYLHPGSPVSLAQVTLCLHTAYHCVFYTEQNTLTAKPVILTSWHHNWRWERTLTAWVRFCSGSTKYQGSSGSGSFQLRENESSVLCAESSVLFVSQMNIY